MKTEITKLGCCKGFTLIEIIVVAALLLLTFSISVFWFRSSSQHALLLERNTFFESAWQSSLQWLRQDLRSADSFEVKTDKLALTYAHISPADQSIDLRRVLYHANGKGELCRLEVGGAEKKILLVGQKSKLQTTLSFALIASKSVEIKLGIFDKDKNETVFNRTELINTILSDSLGEKL